MRSALRPWPSISSAARFSPGAVDASSRANSPFARSTGRAPCRLRSSPAGARNDVGAEGDHQPAERPRQGDPRAGDAQGAQGDGPVRRRGHFAARHGARQRLRARDARLSRRQRTSGIAQGLVAWALASGVECLEVSEAVLGKLSSKDNPQSMLGVFKQRWTEPPPAARVERDAVWLALEEVRDPGNLGTIIRTADAVGADRYHSHRIELRSLLARVRARHHGLGLRRAAGADDARGFLALDRRLARRHRRHASRCARRISAPPSIARRRCC